MNQRKTQHQFEQTKATWMDSVRFQIVNTNQHLTVTLNPNEPREH